jgi:hypothetical protein
MAWRNDRKTGGAEKEGMTLLRGADFKGFLFYDNPKGGEVISSSYGRNQAVYRAGLRGTATGTGSIGESRKRASHGGTKK